MNHTKEPRLIDSGNLVDDALYRAFDELYFRGWQDRHKGKDYDPRGTTQWQAVLDLFRYQRDELLAVMKEASECVKTGFPQSAICLLDEAIAKAGGAA